MFFRNFLKRRHLSFFIYNLFSYFHHIIYRFKTIYNNSILKCVSNCGFMNKKIKNKTFNKIINSVKPIFKNYLEHFFVRFQVIQCSNYK